MEPMSLSLMAISASGVALRRIALDPEVVAEFPAHRVEEMSDPDEPRSSILALLAAGLRIRRLFLPDHSPMLQALARFVASEGLRMDLKVSLAALFESGAEDTAEVANVLRQRKIDVVISDMDGNPLCGIEMPSGHGPAHRDAVCRMAFKGAGLPLLTLRTKTDWPSFRTTLIAALKLDEIDDDLEDEVTDGAASEAPITDEVAPEAVALAAPTTEATPPEPVALPMRGVETT